MSLAVAEQPSPNFNNRRPGAVVDVIVLHYTGMVSAEAAIARLCDPDAKVSSHYLVNEEGVITRMVAEEKRAWHAGISSWAGENDVNSRSVGIEIANGGHEFGCPAYIESQMRSLAVLCQDIIARRHILGARVLGHSDIAPERKSDPGEWFDWAWLARQGVGLWVTPAPLTEGPVLAMGDHGDMVAELQYQLASYGYGLEVLGVYDEKTKAVVTAFQRHFRQAKVDGIADLSTVGTLQHLIESARGD